jgi:hypothetical protein
MLVAQVKKACICIDGRSLYTQNTVCVIDFYQLAVPLLLRFNHLIGIAAKALGRGCCFARLLFNVGTDRTVSTFQLYIEKLENGNEQERCTVWGNVSFTAEIDFDYSGTEG